MSLNTNHPVVNPRLGASFAIFTSAFVCLVLMLIILEQLGTPRRTISQLIIAMPIAFYLAIGILVRTINVDDFFLSGQRVPPLYNGLSLSANILGGFVILTLTGTLFFTGIDAIAIGIGLVGGLALIAILFSSYIRKAGTYTLPGFLGLRFANRGIRAIAALVLVIPCLLLLAAEIKLGAITASYFVPVPRDTLMLAGTACAVATVILGGMRSLTWTQCAQAIVLLVGISIPVTAVSVMLTNMPLPQLTYGYVLQQLSQLEVAKSLISAPNEAQTLSQALPSPGFVELTRPFAKFTGSFSLPDFIMLALCVMLGSSVLPAQIARLGTTPAIPAVRKSLGWAVAFTGFIVITLAAYAVFTKYLLAQEIIGQPMSEIPQWGQIAQSLGMLKISGDQLNPVLGEVETVVNRDAVALLLPMAGKLPFVFIGVVAAAAIAAVLAAVAGQLVSIANALSNDVYYGLLNRAASPSRRLFVARLGIAAAAAGGLWLATNSAADPLRLVLWALSLAAGTLFPVMFFAVWWRKTTAFAAVLGLLSGLCVTGGYILMTKEGGALLFGVDNLTAAILGVPIAAGVIIAMSIVAPAADDRTREFLEEMRLAAGETLYARSLRLASRGRQQKA